MYEMRLNKIIKLWLNTITKLWIKKELYSTIIKPTKMKYHNINHNSITVDKVWLNLKQYSTII
jgi:hypothetical protein